MANQAILRGFMPVGNTGGGPGYIRRFAHLAADGVAVGRGDFVTATGAVGTPTDYGSNLGIPVVAQSATGGVLEGASLNYIVLSTLGSVWAQTDPNTIFEGRVNGTGIANADQQLNANFVVTAVANVTTGLSQMEINGASEATTNTLDLRLLHVLPYVGDDDTLTNPHYLVRINRHRYVDQVAGI